tara:strand:- start:462 stop:653 length:192 start_codon:yes stop_codon:yes gene_type:complete
MPIIQVNMMEGRTDEQKETLISELTQACVNALDAPQQSVRIMINELPKQHFGIAGESAKKLGK